MSASTPPSIPRLGRPFWLFWTGQTISNLGSSFTAFAVPLLVFQLTGSALDLALSSATATIPGVLFGLLIGAWVDRVDRKRLMISTDLTRAVVIASIPVLTFCGLLPIWWIYAVGFVNALLAVCFGIAQVTAVARLVRHDDLVTANGRISASFAAVSVIGPLLAGFSITYVAPATLLLVDALSFVISAGFLARILTSFNTTTAREPTKLLHDVTAGLGYLLNDPILRAIAMVAALVNFAALAVGAQFVLFAKDWLKVNDTELGILFAAESVGVFAFSLAAGYMRKYFPFSRVALGSLLLYGILTTILAATSSVWLAILLTTLRAGSIMLFNINVISLRQAIVPNAYLGRVTSGLNVLAGSVAPVGALVGGLLVERTQNISLLYSLCGGTIVLISIASFLTPLGHAERYLPEAEATKQL